MVSIPIDVSEEPKCFKLFASLPGIQKERIILDVDGDVIRISTDKEKVRSHYPPKYNQHHRIKSRGTIFTGAGVWFAGQGA